MRRIRVGHHSTSDDSFAYRPRKEVEERKRLDNPIVRFRLFLESRGWWTQEEEDALKARVRAEVHGAYKKAESLQRPELSGMFKDVYAGEEPWNLVRVVFHLIKHVADCDGGRLQRSQREEMKRLVQKYGRSWEPWKAELKKFKGEGKEWMD